MTRWKNTRTLSFHAARKAFVEGSQTPRDFLEKCLAAIEAAEKDLKAFVVLDIEAARRSADAATERYRSGRPLSVLDGCPIGIKDIIETENMPTGFGSPAFTNNHTGRDAAAVQALRQGGAVIVGKTVTTEFAIGFSGATTNPHDFRRTPGGSSSGSAAAVGAGLLPVALGSQTQGSILRPASFCGVFGFKATFGAIPMGGVHPVSFSHDHLGVLAGSLEDTWATLSYLSNAIGNPGFRPLQGASYELPDAAKPKRLIRLYTRAWEEELDDASRRAMDDQVAELRAAGIEIVDRHDEPSIDALENLIEAGVKTSLDMVAYEMRWPYTDYIRKHGNIIGQRIRDLVETAKSITPAQYDDLLTQRETVRAAVRKAAANADGFLSLAASGPAPIGLEYSGSRTFLVPWSYLGFPAMSLPLMSVDGMPLGLQIMHVDHMDGRLCAHANWIVRNSEPTA